MIFFSEGNPFPAKLPAGFLYQNLSRRSLTCKHFTHLTLRIFFHRNSDRPKVLLVSTYRRHSTSLFAKTTGLVSSSSCSTERFHFYEVIDGPRNCQIWYLHWNRYRANNLKVMRIYCTRFSNTHFAETTGLIFSSRISIVISKLPGRSIKNPDVWSLNQMSPRPKLPNFSSINFLFSIFAMNLLDYIKVPIKNFL